MENEVDRWTFTKDMNLDGVFTIADVGQWIGWVFFLPGDLLIEGILLSGPGLAVFLELSRADFGGVLSGIVSVMGWGVDVAVVVVVAAKSEYGEV